jgi:hypothetical protein
MDYDQWEERRPRGRFLWWIAGADQKILAECPQADQIFVQHLGVSLSIAFFFVLLCTATAALVAFPAVSLIGTIGALVMALLVACSVFLVDRLFIQADWEWQARKHEYELARARWEAGEEDEHRYHLLRRFRGGFGRFIIVGGRLTLAAAIGFTVASFLELVIYKDEIKSQIEKLHYQENAAVYANIDQRQKQLDADIVNARAERDRLQTVAADLQSKLSAVIVAGNGAAAANGSTNALAAQIVDLRAKITALREQSAAQSQQMVCEEFGAALNPSCSGHSGKGQRYATARALKAEIENQILIFETQLATLAAEQQSTAEREAAAAAATTASYNAQVDDLKRQTNAAIASRDIAQQKYDEMNRGRDAEMKEFVAAVEASPDYVPISYGMASQFRALAALYTDYGIQFEKFMVKFLIILIELIPVLQKLFLSPKTLYALKLDSERKQRAYAHLDETMLESRAAAEALEAIEDEPPYSIAPVDTPVSVVRREDLRSVGSNANSAQVRDAALARPIPRRLSGST